MRPYPLVYIAVCCISLSFCMANALYSKTSPVKLLSASEFKSQVLESNDLFLVEFFASWCGHCKALAPEYEKAARALRGIVSVVAVEDQAVMQEFKVQGFPTIMVIAGKGGKTPKSFDYKGPRDANGIVDFVVSHVGKLVKARLSGKIDAGTDSKSRSSEGQNAKPKSSGPSAVVDLKDSTFDKLVMADKDSVWFIKFYAPWCGHCKAIAPLWDELADSLKGKVKVGKIDATKETVLANRFAIQGFPTLKIFPLGDKSDALVKDYEGARTTEEMAKFALEFYSASAVAEELVSQKMLEDSCTQQLCLISFLPHIIDSKTPKRLEYLDTLNQVLRASITMPITFFWAQGGDQYEFEEQLQMAFGYPAVIAIHLGKGKYSIHRGDFSKESINSFLSQLLSGRAPISSLPSGLTKWKTVESWDGKDAAPPAVDDEL